MSNGRENVEYFFREAQPSVSLLGFDVEDLDDDVTLLNNISSWLAESNTNKGASDSPHDGRSISDDKASSTTTNRRRRKRTRRNCAMVGCTNRVVQGGVCVAHGAKRKLCKEEGCDKAVKKAGFCSSHGPARKKCEVPGCSRVAVQGGICIGHGAKQTACAMDGCRRKATQEGLCKCHLDIAVPKAFPAASPAMSLVPAPALASVTSIEPLNRPPTEYPDSVPCYDIPNPAVAAAVAQAPAAPSWAFQKTMYARGLSIFEEMGVLGKPLPPPPPLGLPKPQLVRSPSFSEDLDSLCDGIDFGVLKEIDKFESQL